MLNNPNVGSVSKSEELLRNVEPKNFDVVPIGVCTDTDAMVEVYVSWLRLSGFDALTKLVMLPF